MGIHCTRGRNPQSQSLGVSIPTFRTWSLYGTATALTSCIAGHSSARTISVLLSCKVLDELVPTFLFVTLLSGKVKALGLYLS